MKVRRVVAVAKVMLTVELGLWHGVEDCGMQRVVGVDLIRAL